MVSPLTGAQRHILMDRRNSEMANRRLLASIAFVVLLMMSIVGTNLIFTAAIGTDAGSGDLFRQAGLLAACGLLVIAQIDFPGTRPPMAMPMTFWLILAYCLVSVTWSIAPMISARRLVLTGIAMWVTIRAVGDLGAVRSLNLLRWILIVVLIANFAAVFLTPFGIHTAVLGDTDTTAGDWRGIFTHKNAAGPVAAVTILLFLFDRRKFSWLISIPVIAFSAFFLYKSGSKTSMVVLPPALLVGWIMLYYDPRQRFLVWAAILSAISTIVAVLVYSPKVARLLDDPRAFTGRGRIWHLLFEYARENPWFGSGYGAFWQIGPASPVYRFDNGWVSKFVGHGHNGYLDLFVTIGLPGMIVAIVCMIAWPVFKLLSAWQIAPQRRAILAAIIFYCALHNLSESSLLGSTPVQILLLVAVAVTHHLAGQSEGRHQDLRKKLGQPWARRSLADQVPLSSRHEAQAG